ncbi:MAG TPA: hypothetical protein VD905_02690 [Flavobacteriales bacterium]|nr:hypothetical protein [Flavobacteriales bacterium]
MEPKDVINYMLSSMAVIMSMSALVFGVIFQRKERKRNIRQTLTNTLNQIAGINVELSKLVDGKNEEEAVDKIAIRRNYNLQRSILIVDADFLIHENYKLVTATDCALLAGTYSAIGYIEKADYFWKESIEKTDHAILKHVNMREYASFLFHQNHLEKGRKQFEKALSVALNDSDEELRIVIDTYAMWAKLERAFGEEAECKKLIALARKTGKNIRNQIKHNESGAMIDALEKGKKRTK